MPLPAWEHSSKKVFVFFNNNNNKKQKNMDILHILVYWDSMTTSQLVCLFVCVEVLRPSQPNGVMSSAVSLPNHTFTGQA